MYVVNLVLVLLSLEILSTSDAAVSIFKISYFNVANVATFLQMTMKQLKNSLEMMRKACAPKFNVVEASLDELKAGRFANEADKELKCYTMCIAQMAGTVSFSDIVFRDSIFFKLKLFSLYSTQYGNIPLK